ncbi:MAG TPA: cytochrome b/b6 domain-containing protein [Anaerolineales bacterium]|nr:cytochrome b/b6 domain-containing protein [Anaerolineales bacterium]
MSNESPPTRYHPFHVALHWLIALMVIGAIAIGMLYLDSPNAPEKIPYLQLHSMWGFVLIALMVVRLITRFALKRPADATTGNSILDGVAKVTHFLLYFLVLGMLVSGFGMSMQANLMAVFQGQAELPADFRVFPPRIGHGLTYSLLFIVILLHIGAAFYHQFVRKDKLMARMWFGRR